MPYLLDTNLLLRSVDPTSLHHAAAVAAIRRLGNNGEELCVIPQVIVEFWSAASRPAGPPANGLGLEIPAVRRAVREFLADFPMLPDRPAVFAEWLQLVEQHGVTGRQVHDARIVAAMRVHGLDRIVTFNGADFRRYHGLIIVDPADVQPEPTRPSSPP